MSFSTPHRPSKRLACKMGKSLSTDNWPKLHFYLLELISKRLSPVELLAFGSVCKEWHSVSCMASAKKRAPWFLLYGNKSNCQLYDLLGDKIYKIHIPELDGTTCIASLDGWLLLYQDRSMFFFCPFSRAKIDLPEFPHSTLSNHVAAFSSSPTYPDCVVCVVSHQNNTLFELNLLRRGAKEWAKHELHCNQRPIKTVTSATFSNGIFYFLDGVGTAVTFGLENEEFLLCRLRASSDRSLPKLPFASVRKSSIPTIKQKLGLEEFDSLSVCGTILSGNRNAAIHNEDYEAGEGKELHRMKGVWIEPQFFRLPANQNWSL